MEQQRDFIITETLINTVTGGPYSTSTTPSTTTDHIGSYDGAHLRMTLTVI